MEKLKKKKRGKIMVTNILILSKANGISYNLVNIMNTKKK